MRKLLYQQTVARNKILNKFFVRILLHLMFRFWLCAILHYSRKQEGFNNFLLDPIHIPRNVIKSGFKEWKLINFSVLRVNQFVAPHWDLD